MPRSNGNNLFIVWNPFQRRAQSIGRIFNLNVRYYHYCWEEQGKIFKAASYIFKFLGTLIDLYRYRPAYIFVQLAPTPLLYAAAFYCAFAKCKYIADCHNTMIYDAHWIKWPFAIKMLSRSFILLVHNDDVRKHAKAIGLNPIILRDPLPTISVPQDAAKIAGIDIKTQTYVIVPCGMAVDEPVEELFLAAREIPEARFVMTWYADKLPPALRKSAPDNLCFTGYLEEASFNALYASAKAAIVLTTREGTQPSGASEAIALGVPLVVSDIQTTRRLYKDAPIFVKNNPESIAKGIKLALADYQTWAERIAGLKNDLKKDVEMQAAAMLDLMQKERFVD